MKVTVIKKDVPDAKKEEKNDDVQDQLPADDENQDAVDLDQITDEEDAPRSSERERQLELEKAKLEGQLELFRGNGGKSSVDQQRQSQMNAVYKDLSLDDEEFKEKYQGWSKVQVVQGINDQKQTETSVKMNKLQVQNSLARKYPDFIEFEDEVEKALADAAPEVLQDPARLKRFMEREYVVLQKESERRGAIPKTRAAAAKSKEEPVKKIVRDFTPPTPRADDKDDASGGADELREEDRPLAAKFGIKTESQRKKFMSAFIPMDFGGGIRFEDPKKGFEKTEQRRAS